MTNGKFIAGVALTIAAAVGLFYDCGGCRTHFFTRTYYNEGMGRKTANNTSVPIPTNYGLDAGIESGTITVKSHDDVEDDDIEDEANPDLRVSDLRTITKEDLRKEDSKGQKSPETPTRRITPETSSAKKVKKGDSQPASRAEFIRIKEINCADGRHIFRYAHIGKGDFPGIVALKFNNYDAGRNDLYEIATHNGVGKKPNCFSSQTYLGMPAYVFVKSKKESSVQRGEVQRPRVTRPNTRPNADTLEDVFGEMPEHPAPSSTPKSRHPQRETNPVPEETIPVPTEPAESEEDNSNSFFDVEFSSGSTKDDKQALYRSCNSIFYPLLQEYASRPNVTYGKVSLSINYTVDTNHKVNTFNVNVRDGPSGLERFLQGKFADGSINCILNSAIPEKNYSSNWDLDLTPPRDPEEGQ